VDLHREVGLAGQAYRRGSPTDGSRAPNRQQFSFERLRSTMIVVQNAGLASGQSDSERTPMRNATPPGDRSATTDCRVDSQLEAKCTTSSRELGEPDFAAEAQRLQELVGPDEYSYSQLKLELWSVRDLFIGMEAELGNLRGRCLMLERDLEARGRSLTQAHEETRSATSSSVGLGATLLGRARNLRDGRS
jgi:hypothetical protein